MLTSRINFTNFKFKKKKTLVNKKLKILLNENSEILKSLGKNYKNSYNKKILTKFRKNTNFRIFGMGGSILGAQTIYQFLRKKIKKNFVFVDNLQINENKFENKNFTNIVISKSGNTIETIVNSNIYIKKEDKNIFITEDKKIIYIC